MMNLYETIKKFKIGEYLREFDKRVIITTLIFFKGYDESVAMYIEPTEEEDVYKISDCHSVSDYWEVCYINKEDYKEQIDKIGLGYEDRCFYTKIRAFNEQDLYSGIWRFIEKVFLLANIESLK